jgi:hypothetical protein
MRVPPSSQIFPRTQIARREQAVAATLLSPVRAASAVRDRARPSGPEALSEIVVKNSQMC